MRRKRLHRNFHDIWKRGRIVLTTVIAQIRIHDIAVIALLTRFNHAVRINASRVEQAGVPITVSRKWIAVTVLPWSVGPCVSATSGLRRIAGLSVIVRARARTLALIIATIGIVKISIVTTFSRFFDPVSTCEFMNLKILILIIKVGSLRQKRIPQLPDLRLKTRGIAIRPVLKNSWYRKPYFQICFALSGRIRRMFIASVSIQVLSDIGMHHRITLTHGKRDVLVAIRIFLSRFELQIGNTDVVNAPSPLQTIARKTYTRIRISSRRPKIVYQFGSRFNRMIGGCKLCKINPAGFRSCF